MHERSNCSQSKDAVRKEGKRGKAHARPRGEKKNERRERLARRAVKMLLLAPLCILFGRLTAVEPF